MQSTEMVELTDQHVAKIQEYARHAQTLLGADERGGLAFAFLRGVAGDPNAEDTLDVVAVHLAEAIYSLPAVRRAYALQFTRKADEWEQIELLGHWCARMLKAYPARVAFWLNRHREMELEANKQ